MKKWLIASAVVLLASLCATVFALPLIDPYITSTSGCPSGVACTPTFTGGNLIQGQTQVDICPHPCTGSNEQLSIPVLDAGNGYIQMSIANGMLSCSADAAVCPYDVLVNNINKGHRTPFSTMRGALSVSYTTTPPVCASNAGGSLFSWYNAGSYSSGTWSDLSGGGHNLTCTGVTTNSSDSNWNNKASLNFNGTSTECTASSVNLGGGTTTIFVYANTRTTTTGTEYVWSYSSGSAVARYQTATGAALFVAGGSSNAALFTPTLNIPMAWYGFIIGGNPLTGGVNVGQSSSTEVDFTDGNSALPTTGNFIVGYDGTTNYFTGTMTDMVVLARTSKPSNSEIQCYYDYFNSQYNLDSSPTITACTSVPSTGGLIRCQGTNIAAGVTVSSPLIGTLTSSRINSTTFQATVPAGTYTLPLDITVTNPDGDAFTMVGAVTPHTNVGTDCDAWSEVNTGVLVGDYLASTVACSPDCSATGHSITSAIDNTYMHAATDLAQGTMANQPTIKVADANWGGNNSFSFTSTQWLTTSSYLFNWNFGGTTDTDIYFFVFYRTVASLSSGTDYEIADYSNDNMRIAVFHNQQYMVPPGSLFFYSGTLSNSTDYAMSAAELDAGVTGSHYVQLNQTTTSTPGTPQNTTAGSTSGLPDNSNLFFGASNGGSAGANSTVYEFIVANKLLTTGGGSQEAAILACAHAKGAI